MKRKRNILDHKRYTFAYFPGTSIMHNLNPISKLIFLILLTISLFLINSILLLALILLLLLILALLSNISLKNLLRKLRFIIIVLIFSVILNIFFNAIPNENEIVLFYLFNLPFLPIRRLAVYFALRSFLIILTLYTSAIIYSNTTDMKDFVYSLIRLKFPYKYCFSFMVGIKYIPTIEEEAKTIALAQRARGFGLEKVNTVKKAYKLIFERLVTTLVSVLRKGHISSISMENRCFGLYKKRTNLIRVKYKANDLIFLILTFCGFLFILFYLLNIIPLPHFPSLYNIFKNIF
ncbi:MAG: energy-coupling factor transporter transmembrane component T family protein [Candidatus Thorarchaeota archaeon]